jgi:hypothetical protein
MVLGVGLVLAGIGVTALWRQDLPDTSRALPPPVVSRAAQPAPRPTPQDIKVLRAEVAHLKAERQDVQQLAKEIRSELTALRSQLIQVEQDQASMGLERTKTARASRAEGTAADTPPLTAEEEHERAKAQIRAQIEVFEGTMLMENADPAWASAAELALQEALQREAIAGLRLVQADCRTSLCRLDLALDSSLSPEGIFEQLIHLTPWNGHGFVQIDEESGEAVVYLSREGHELPQ